MLICFGTKMLACTSVADLANRPPRDREGGALPPPLISHPLASPALWKGHLPPPPHGKTTTSTSVPEVIAWQESLLGQKLVGPLDIWYVYCTVLFPIRAVFQSSRGESIWKLRRRVHTFSLLCLSQMGSIAVMSTAHQEKCLYAEHDCGLFWYFRDME